MVAVRWERYPLVATSDSARTWLHIQADLGLARNTVEAYGRAMQDYLQFSRAKGVDPCRANKAHIAAYVRDLTARPNPRGPTIRVLDSGAGLANATLQQRLTAVRLFHDYLMEEGVRPDNPVGRGRIRPYLKAMFVALSMGLVQLGILREPLGPDVKDGGRSGLPDPLHGVPSEWASWCERWRATSTLAPGTRKAVFHIALRAGRWLKSAHPEVTSPGQWDRALAAEFVAAVDRCNGGEWTSLEPQRAAHRGKPISPGYKAQHLWAMSAFLKDCQEWEWIPRRFDPTRCFATPRTIRALIAPNPCTYDFFDQCPHRMACAKCAFYRPKGSSEAQLLEAKENLLHLKQEIPLTEEETAAVDDGLDALERLCARLADVPTPAGPTPKELR